MIANRIPDGIDLVVVMKRGVVDGGGGAGAGARLRSHGDRKGAMGEEERVEARGMLQGRIMGVLSIIQN